MKTPDPQRKHRLRLLTSLAKEKIKVTPSIIEKAKFLKESGIKSVDALHIACADDAKIDLFLTTDKQLISKAKSSNDVIIGVLNPVDWIESE